MKRLGRQTDEAVRMSGVAAVLTRLTQDHTILSHKSSSMSSVFTRICSAISTPCVIHGKIVLLESRGCQSLDIDESNITTRKKDISSS